MPHLVEFEWYRDETQTGWTVKPEELPKSVSLSSIDPRGENGTLPAALSINISTRKPLRIVHRNGKLRRYWPLRDYNKLYDQFSRIATAQELLSFVERFGPLSIGGLNPDEGDNVTHLLVHAKQMRSLIEAYRTGRTKEIAKILGPKGLPLGDGPIGDVKATLVFDQVTQKPRLQFIPRNLLNAIWLQLGEHLSGDLNLMECRFCGKTFERGPGHRRADSKFCSDEHKAAFHSKQRSIPSKSKLRRRA